MEERKACRKEGRKHGMEDETKAKETPKLHECKKDMNKNAPKQLNKKDAQKKY